MLVLFYISCAVAIYFSIMIVLELRWLPFHYDCWVYEQAVKERLQEMGIDPNLSTEEILEKIKEKENEK